MAQAAGPLVGRAARVAPWEQPEQVLRVRMESGRPVRRAPLASLDQQMGLRAVMEEQAAPAERAVQAGATNSK